MKIRSLQELVDRANQMGGTLGAAAMALQVEQDRDDPIQMREKMRQALEVMRQSVESGMDPHTHSVSGLTGGQAARLMAVAESGESVGGTDLTRAAARALAVAEFNAAMAALWPRPPPAPAAFSRERCSPPRKNSAIQTTSWWTRYSAPPAWGRSSPIGPAFPARRGAVRRNAVPPPPWPPRRWCS